MKRVEGARRHWQPIPYVLPVLSLLLHTWHTTTPSGVFRAVRRPIFWGFYIPPEVLSTSSFFYIFFYEKGFEA